jgi:hypothetical protein
VWTDATRDPAELRAEVRSVVARSHMATPWPEPLPPVVDHGVSDISSAADSLVGRRGGLGRGLDSIIASTDGEPAPAHLISFKLTASPVLDLIAVEESASGITVRAVDSTSSVAEAKVIGGSRSLNSAIVAAVAELLGEMPAPRLVSVELRDTDVAPVLVVTVELADTTLAAGAAVVQGGMPFTLGRATWAAVTSART